MRKGKSVKKCLVKNIELIILLKFNNPLALLLYLISSGKEADIEFVFEFASTFYRSFLNSHEIKMAPGHTNSTEPRNYGKRFEIGEKRTDQTLLPYPFVVIFIAKG